VHAALTRQFIVGDVLWLTDIPTLSVAVEEHGHGHVVRAPNREYMLLTLADADDTRATKKAANRHQ